MSMDYKDEEAPHKSFTEDVIDAQSKDYIKRGDLEDSLDLNFARILEIIDLIDSDLKDSNISDVLNNVSELSAMYSYLYHQSNEHKININSYIEVISNSKVEDILTSLLNPNLENIGTLDPDGHPAEYQLFSHALSLVCILSYFKTDMSDMNSIVSLYPSIFMAFIDEALVSDDMVGKNLCVSLINMAHAEANSESNFDFISEINLCDLFLAFQNRHIPDDISSSLCLALLKFLPHDFMSRDFLNVFLQYYGTNYEKDDNDENSKALDKNVTLTDKSNQEKAATIDEYSDYSYDSTEEVVSEETYFYLMSCIRCFLLRESLNFQRNIFAEVPELLQFIINAIEYELPLDSARAYILGVTALTLSEVYKYYDTFDFSDFAKILNPFRLCKIILSSKEFSGITHNAFILLKSLIKIEDSYNLMIRTWDNPNHFFLMVHQHLIEGNSVTKIAALGFVKSYLKYCPTSIQQFLQTNPCNWIIQHIEGSSTQIQLSTLKIVMKILLNCVPYPASRSEFIDNLVQEDIPDILKDILENSENIEICRETERIIDYAGFEEEDDERY